MQQPITCAVLSLLVLVLCVLRPNAGRGFLGLFFLVMAIGVNDELAPAGNRTRRAYSQGSER